MAAAGIAGPASMGMWLYGAHIGHVPGMGVGRPAAPPLPLTAPMHAACLPRAPAAAGVCGGCGASGAPSASAVRSLTNGADVHMGTSSPSSSRASDLKKRLREEGEHATSSAEATRRGFKLGGGKASCSGKVGSLSSINEAGSAGDSGAEQPCPSKTSGSNSHGSNGSGHSSDSSNAEVESGSRSNTTSSDVTASTADKALSHKQPPHEKAAPAAEGQETAGSPQESLTPSPT